MTYRFDGFNNALAFQEITDESIAQTEKFVREEMYSYLIRSAADTINEYNESFLSTDDDVLITKEQLIDHFGKIYATDPFNFRFQSGDIILIKEMVKFVKDKLGSQQKKGLKLFKTDRSKKANKLSTKSSISEPSIENLTHDLILGVIDCMKAYGADQFFDIEIDNIIYDKTVNVQIRQSVGVIGTVCCEICAQQNMKKNKPKRVFYNDASKWPGWVLSNFAKHLKNVHKLKICRELKSTQKSKSAAFTCDTEQKKKSKSAASTCDVNNHIESENELSEEQNGSDVVIVDEEVYVVVDVVAENSAAPFEIEETQYKIPILTQLTDQINIMLPAVLQNSDKREEIDFMINNSMQALNVVKIGRDGDCLFSSLVHQLFQYKINSKFHKKETRQLRKRVVDYILAPNNFPKFMHELKDRVYQTKKKGDITDIEMECKLWVKFALKKNGTWGGTETIYAVAELEKVNIIIFNEHGHFYKLRNMEEYDRTICIAYRLQQDGYGEIISDTIRDHYDSVCDMNSSTLFDAAKILECRQTT